MNIWENIIVAFQGLAANKLRSALTMLGITIGVFSVILGTAIGQGARQELLGRVQRLGSNSIVVFADPSRGGTAQGAPKKSDQLTPEDADYVLKNSSLVTRVAPQVMRQARVKFRNKSADTNIVCTTPDYTEISNYQLAAGAYFTARDVRGRRKVCVVGKTIADKLFGGGTPIGKTLRIQGMNFTIVGLLRSKGSSLFGDPDDQILIPLTTGMKQVFGVEGLTMISAQTAKADDSDQAVEQIQNALRKRNKIKPPEKDNFDVRSQQELMNFGNTATQILTFLLSGIAGVALLVGGIGIMNIMLVSVTERTREIGIRKAMGARNFNILFQFLIEALTLSVTGGLIGIGGGYLVSALLTTYTPVPALVSPLWVSVAFFVSAGIGVFFGIYPAYKAAQLDPIEALRFQ